MGASLDASSNMLASVIPRSKDWLSGTGLDEIRLDEIGLNVIGADEIELGVIGFDEIGLAEIGLAEIGLAEGVIGDRVKSWEGISGGTVAVI